MKILTSINQEWNGSPANSKFYAEITHPRWGVIIIQLNAIKVGKVKSSLNQSCNINLYQPVLPYQINPLAEKSFKRQEHLWKLYNAYKDNVEVIYKAVKQRLMDIYNVSKTSYKYLEIKRIAMQEAGEIAEKAVKTGNWYSEIAAYFEQGRYKYAY